MASGCEYEDDADVLGGGGEERGDAVESEAQLFEYDGLPREDCEVVSVDFREEGGGGGEEAGNPSDRTPVGGNGGNGCGGKGGGSEKEGGIGGKGSEEMGS